MTKPPHGILNLPSYGSVIVTMDEGGLADIVEIHDELKWKTGDPESLMFNTEPQFVNPKDKHRILDELCGVYWLGIMRGREEGEKENQRVIRKAFGL